MKMFAFFPHLFQFYTIFEYEEMATVCSEKSGEPGILLSPALVAFLMWPNADMPYLYMQ